MKCVICKTGETHPGHANVTLHRGQSTVVLKDVPAEVCDNCGEYYLSERLTEQTLELANEAVERGTEIEVLRFAA